MDPAEQQASDIGASSRRLGDAVRILSSGRVGAEEAAENVRGPLDESAKASDLINNRYDVIPKSNDTMDNSSNGEKSLAEQIREKSSRHKHRTKDAFILDSSTEDYQVVGRGHPKQPITALGRTKSEGASANRSKTKYKDCFAGANSEEEDDDDDDDGDCSEGDYGKKMMEFMNISANLDKEEFKNGQESDGNTLLPKEGTEKKKHTAPRDRPAFRGGLERARSEHSVSREPTSRNLLQRIKSEDSGAAASENTARDSSRSPSSRPRLDRSRSDRRMKNTAKSEILPDAAAVGSPSKPEVGGQETGQILGGWPKNVCARKRREHRSPRPALSRGCSGSSPRKDNGPMNDISDTPVPPTLTRGVTTENPHQRRGHVDLNNMQLPRSMRPVLDRSVSEKGAHRAERKPHDSGVLDAGIFGQSEHGTKHNRSKSTDVSQRSARTRKPTSRKAGEPKTRDRSALGGPMPEGEGDCTKRSPSRASKARDRSTSAGLASNTDEDAARKNRARKARDRDRSTSAGLASDTDEDAARRSRARKARDRDRSSSAGLASDTDEDAARRNRARKARERSASANVSLTSDTEDDSEMKSRTRQERRPRGRSASEGGPVSGTEDDAARRHRTRKPHGRKHRSNADKDGEHTDTHHETAEHKRKGRGGRSRRSPCRDGAEPRNHSNSPTRVANTRSHHKPRDIARSQYENVVKNYDPEVTLDQFGDEEELDDETAEDTIEEPEEVAPAGEGKKAGMFMLALASTAVNRLKNTTHAVTKTAVSVTKTAASTATQTASNTAKLGAKVATTATTTTLNTAKLGAKVATSTAKAITDTLGVSTHHGNKANEQLMGNSMSELAGGILDQSSSAFDGDEFG